MQIERECKHRTSLKRVSIYAEKGAEWTWTASDVVITTVSVMNNNIPWFLLKNSLTLTFLQYAMLSRSCPWPTKAEQTKLNANLKKTDKTDLAQDDKSSMHEQWIQDNRSRGGILHQIDWYRRSSSLLFFSGL
jgi:hypothetical protein